MNILLTSKIGRGPYHVNATPCGCACGDCGWPPLAQDSKYKLLILVTGDFFFPVCNLYLVPTI